MTVAKQKTTFLRSSDIVNIEWSAGSTFEKPFYYLKEDNRLFPEREDLSGCTAAMQVRDGTDTVVLDLSSVAGDIEIEPAAYANAIYPVPGGSRGVVLVKISASVLDANLWSDGDYDLLITFPDTTTISRWRGSFLLFPEMTRP